MVVIKRSTFFASLDLMFKYAHDPKRCSWEFYSYRPWQYILSTWCATFDVKGSAFSCGAQHPFLYRVPPANKVIEYCLPDYALIFTIPSLTDRANQLVLVGEVKPIGISHPDTVEGQQIASGIFVRTMQQRDNQARLGFRDHPDQDTIKILMMCGPWFSIYTYHRSTFLPESTSNGDGEPPDDAMLDARPRDRSPPNKARRQSMPFPLLYVGTAQRQLTLLVQTSVYFIVVGLGRVPPARQPTRKLLKQEPSANGGRMPVQLKSLSNLCTTFCSSLESEHSTPGFFCFCET